jgi:cobaltochelatase CobN
MRVSFIVGYGASMLPLLSRVVREEAEEHGFEPLAINSDLSERCSKEVAESDAIILYAHELPEAVEGALKESRARIVAPVDDYYLHLSRGPPSLLSEVRRYFKVGGEKNFRSLVHLILRGLGLPVDVEPVEDVPWHGIHHPKLGTFRDLASYLRAYELKKPAVGVLFYRTYWLYGNARFIDDLVSSIEEEGMGVIPGLHLRLEGRLRRERVQGGLHKGVLHEGLASPFVDAVVNATFFFLLDHGEWERRRFAEVEGVRLLKRLGVPVMNLVLCHYRSVDEWLSDPQGVDYLTQVYSVVMPEVDGAVEPIFIAGARMTRAA